jgi:hypothetical protein
MWGDIPAKAVPAAVKCLPSLKRFVQAGVVFCCRDK